MPRPIDEPVTRRPPYFWWLLINLLALCFAVLSWVFCLEVFGNPEVPRNYRILKKLNQLPTIQSFKPSEVPEGVALGPKQIYSKFFRLTDQQYERFDQQSKRDLINNFEEAGAVAYVYGDYQVESTSAFGGSDFLITGFAVRGRALVRPDDFSKLAPYPVVVEFMFPTDDHEAIEAFPEGHQFSIPRAGRHVWVVMHISKTWVGDEQGILLSVMPITEGTCELGKGRTFSIKPPKEVRPAGGFPVMESSEL